MDTIRNMKAFVAVAETSSFTKAAHQLSTTLPVISRWISELEGHLRTRLLNRTTRRVALTEAGQRYLERCREILASVAAAEAEASDARAIPAGTLRIHAMSSIGQNYVIPAIAAYQACYPEVTVDLTLTQGVPDLLEEGYDVAIRLSRDALPDSNLVSHHLGAIRTVLCAAPRYLEVHGTPRTVKDLARHSCLQLALPMFASDRWLLIGPDGEREFQLPASRFKVNMPDAMAVALHEGMGIGTLPTLAIRSALRAGSLVRVLPDYHLQELNVYAVYASRQYLDAKIRTWVQFVREWITDAIRADDIGIAGTPGKDVEPRLPRNMASVRDGSSADFARPVSTASTRVLC
ncbi:LysR family transcriptional regulator [Trinickia mobilis]|uniref:LysR family transcriptional regulator n=1 Tax=Trinickia mobilis TaxID=2816356 RepID=UPI001A90683C|nr:LysR family transcriptional regulator [Trinickia mobilis]